MDEHRSVSRILYKMQHRAAVIAEDHVLQIPGVHQQPAGIDGMCGIDVAVLLAGAVGGERHKGLHLVAVFAAGMFTRSGFRLLIPYFISSSASRRISGASFALLRLTMRV